MSGGNGRSAVSEGALVHGGGDVEVRATKLAAELSLVAPGELGARMNGMLELEVRVGGAWHSNVRLVRAFPVSAEGQYVVLLDAEGQELGVIEDMTQCPAEVQALFGRVLDTAYLVPRITKVHDIAVKGLVPVWEVDTDRGPRRIELRGRRETFALGKRVVLRDADGNRYEIPDFTKLDKRSRRLVEREV